MAPITKDTNLVIKVQLGEKGTRRIPLQQLWDPTTETISYTQLEQILYELSQANANTDTLTISYLDEDGDDITLSTQLELYDAVGQFIDKVPPVLRAKASVNKQGTNEPLPLPLQSLKAALVEIRSKLAFVQESTPLNQDPEFAKYFKMLEMGVPLGAVKQAMKRDGKGDRILDLQNPSIPSRERKEQVSHVLDSILLVLSQALESIAQQVESVKTQASKEYQEATGKGPQLGEPTPPRTPRKRWEEARRRELEQRKVAAMIASQAQVKQQEQQQNRAAKKRLAQAAKKAQLQQMKQYNRARQEKQQERMRQQQEMNTFIHGRHTCDGCLVTPIVGIRYHATNVPDYDLCQKCFPNYKGKEIEFAPEELDRDRHLQTRWQRRQERQNRLARQAQQQQQQTCRNSVSSTASTPKGQQNKAILQSMDAALKEAIRRSLEEALPSKESVQKKEEIASVSAPEVETEEAKDVETTEEEDIVVAPIAQAADENTEPEHVALLAVSAVEAEVEPVQPEPVVVEPVAATVSEVEAIPEPEEAVVETKDVAPNTSANDTESKSSVEKSQADDVVSAVQDLKETITELIRKNSIEEKQVAPPEMAVGDDLKLSCQEDVISEISCASSKKSKQSEQKDANHSRDFSFTEGAEDDVALTIGKALDKCADAIEALQSSHSIASSFEEVSAVESVVSVKSTEEESNSAAIQSENSRGRTILPSVNDTAELVSMSSEEEWQCVENEDDDFAKAAHLLGSAMFQSDIASPSPSAELETSFLSGMTSVPTVTSEISQVLLTRYEDELRQLHQLGFLDDHINVNALEHLEAANIGVGSTDAIKIERVVDHILKNRSP